VYDNNAIWNYMINLNCNVLESSLESRLN